MIDFSREKMSGTELSSSPLDKYLADFENKRTEFLIIGRLASVKLFREGHLQEANKICDAVLGLDPNDVDTQDLKGHVQHFLHHPDEADLSTLKQLDLGSGQSPPSKSMRLQRSFSERRSRRRAQLWSFESEQGSTTTNGHSVQTISGSVDKEEVFLGSNEDSDGSDWSKPHRSRNGLYRSQSESAKTTPISVMQKIQRFEQHARTITASSTTAAPTLKSSGKKSVPIKEKASSPVRNGVHSSPAQKAVPSSPARNGMPSSPERNSVFSPVRNVAPSTPVRTVPASSPVRIAASSPVRNILLSTPPRNGSLGTESSPAEVYLTPPTKPLSPVKQPALSEIKMNQQVQLNSPNSPFRYQVTWTELGLAVNEDLRKQLEIEFFRSPLLTYGCFATFDGDLLGVSRGCKVTKKEIQTLVTGMTKREYITSSKVILSGTIYSCLSATGHVFRARTGTLGINCTTFKKTVLISFYTHPVLPKPVGKLVQKMEEFVSDFGY